MSLPKKIFVMRQDKLGDLCVSLPILEAIRQISPEIRVIWMCRPELTQLVEGHPVVEAVWPVPESLSLGNQVRVLAKLRRWKPDASLLLKFNVQGRWRKLMTWSGIPIRVGSAEYDQGRLTHNTYQPGLEWRTRHEARKTLDMLQAALGQPISDFPSAITLKPELRQSAVAAIDSMNLPRNYFVLQLGMGGSSRAVSPEFFANVAAEIDLPCVLTGVSSEQPLQERFQSSYPKQFVSTLGCTDLPALTELVRRAKFVFSVDTGTVHVAAAMGTPSVVLMPRRCIQPEHWRPWMVPSTVIRPQQFCTGCNEWTCSDQDDLCVKSFSAQEALQSCLSFSN